MKKIKDIYTEFKSESDKRLSDFKIEEIDTLQSISDDAYLERPIWLGGDSKFVCIFIDLNKSSEISNIKQKSTVAKIYDYFTQNAVDILSIDGIKSDYIDIKGDGVFGLYEGTDAVFRAFVAGVTFKGFFQKHISEKFKTDYDVKLNCKLAMETDKILVRKIGRRKFYNEVWAGKLINNVYKIASLDKKIRENNKKDEHNYLIIPENIYDKLKSKESYTLLSCGHSNGVYTGEKVNLWEHFIDDSADAVYKEKVFYLAAQWCDECGDDYIKNILL